MPMACDVSGSPPNSTGPRMAMTGISVSGMAVATAARTLPTAPSARFSRWPNHSIPLVNSSAAIRMIASEPIRRTMSTRQPRWLQGRRCCGAYGSSATWRARFSATVSIRWCRAQVPVLRRGSIFARSER